MTTPTAIPVNGDGTFDDPTWGEGGTYSVSAYEGTGIPTGTLVGVNDMNHPRRHAMRWLRALRDRMVLSDDGLWTNCIVKSGAWNTGGGTLDGTLGVSRLIVDASLNGGVLVEVTVPAGSPHTFTASRDTYVNVNESGALEYQAVATGSSAPTPSAGYVAVWKVVTDGTELTSATSLVNTIPTFLEAGALILRAGYIQTSGNVDVGGNLDVTGTSALDGAVTCGADLTVAGSATLGNGAGDSHEIAGDLLDLITDQCTIGVSSSTALNVFSTTTFQSPVSFNGNVTVGNAGTDTLTVNAAPTFNEPFASDIDMGGNAILDAERMTIDAQSISQFGLQILPDSTSPTHAPLRLGGCGDDPSNVSGGQISWHIGRALGILRFRTDSAWNSLHMSPKGGVRAWSSAAASGTETAGAGTELAPAVMPVVEQTGTVLVTVTGTLEYSVTSEIVLVTLYDTTANANVALGYERGPNTASSDRSKSFCVRGVYTLPSSATRTFVVKLASSNDLVYDNVVVSVEGVA